MMILPPDWSFLSLITVASIAASFTPGPNNTICMVAAVNGGFMRAVPFAFGVVVGFPLLVLGVGTGLGGVLSQWPQLHVIIRICGGCFLLWIAWKIARARDLQGSNQTAPSFWRGVIFQWINPKAVTYAFSMVGAFTRPQSFSSDLFYLLIISMIAAICSTLTWAAGGVGIRRFLHSQKALAIFNGVMGGLLALSALAILWV